MTCNKTISRIGDATDEFRQVDFGGIFQADINALVTYKNMVNFGISYRTSDAVVFQLGYKTPDLFVGYAYDLIVSGLGMNTWGSHEILFSYTLDNFLVK